jgi:hypothetical protein
MSGLLLLGFQIDYRLRQSGQVLVGRLFLGEGRFSRRSAI